MNSLFRPLPSCVDDRLATREIIAPVPLGPPNISSAPVIALACPPKSVSRMSRLLAVTTISAFAGSGDCGSSTGRNGGALKARRDFAAGATRFASRQPLGPAERKSVAVMSASFTSALRTDIRPRSAGTRLIHTLGSSTAILVPVCRPSSATAFPSCPAGKSMACSLADTDPAANAAVTTVMPRRKVMDGRTSSSPCPNDAW